MKIKEDYCYRVAKAFTVDGTRFKVGELLVTCSVDVDEARFYKKCKGSEINELPESELAAHVDHENGYDYFGTCENCGCELHHLPNAGWGVGFVCGTCAQKIRGEFE